VRQGKEKIYGVGEKYLILPCTFGVERFRDLKRGEHLGGDERGLDVHCRGSVTSN